jgi:aminopeptidase N
MSQKARLLSARFSVEKYHLELAKNSTGRLLGGKVTILGKKIGPPSKRLTFHQRNLKIIAAKILCTNKKGQTIDYEVARINHHQSFEEVRLHTNAPMYAGSYALEIHFQYQKPRLISKKQKPLRELFPSIDEPAALSDFDVTYSNE